jgi:hypothetical protein
MSTPKNNNGLLIGAALIGGAFLLMSNTASAKGNTSETGNGDEPTPAGGNSLVDEGNGDESSSQQQFIPPAQPAPSNIQQGANQTASTIQEEGNEEDGDDSAIKAAGQAAGNAGAEAARKAQEAEAARQRALKAQAQAAGRIGAEAARRAQAEAAQKVKEAVAARDRAIRLQAEATRQLGLQRIKEAQAAKKRAEESGKLISQGVANRGLDKINRGTPTNTKIVYKPSKGGGVEMRTVAGGAGGAGLQVVKNIMQSGKPAGKQIPPTGAVAKKPGGGALVRTPLTAKERQAMDFVKKNPNSQVAFLMKRDRRDLYNLAMAEAAANPGAKRTVQPQQPKKPLVAPKPASSKAPQKKLASKPSATGGMFAAMGNRAIARK